MTSLDDDLRAALRSRAEALQVPERPALRADNTPAPRRPATTWMLAAACIVLAIVGVAALALRQAGGSDPAPPVASAAPDTTTAATMPVRTTFVSPTNGYSVEYVDTGEVVVSPATLPWAVDGQPDAPFDVVATDAATVFKGTSQEFLDLSDVACMDSDDERISCPATDELVDQQIDQLLSDGGAEGCRLPRGAQAEITIDGQPGRVAECPNRIEATVVAEGRLYYFVLLHEGSDAPTVFDALVAAIDLTPDTAVFIPPMTTTFVSPTYGYSFGFHDRGGLAPATELWDPANQPIYDIDFDPRFDAVETGYGNYFEAASAEIPDGVSVDEWADEYVTPGIAGGCGVPRSRQEEIIIDGRPGRIEACGHIEATVVAGGRLYLFTAGDNRPWFDAWIATIDLTPETAAVP